MFLLFSLRFMGDKLQGSWTEFEGSPAYYAWRGNAFEIACLGHIPQIKRALGIAAVRTECFPWSSTSCHPGAQVDLAIERQDGVTDLCEMKCTDEPLPITQDLLASLKRKRSVFREESGTANAVHLALVCAPSVKAGENLGEIAATLSIDDLFAQ
jgi:hypothetical protein